MLHAAQIRGALTALAGWISNAAVRKFQREWYLMKVNEREGQIRNWLDEAWDRTVRAAVLDGGEDGPSIAERPTIVTIEDRDSLEKLRKLSTSGEFVGDMCRCPGDLTLALYGNSNALIGSATMHPGRVSWERRRFKNDLAASDAIALRLLLSDFGVNGTSRSLLEVMISALKLSEGDVQFRPVGDAAALTERRVPRALAEELLRRSGEEAGSLDQESVKRLTGDLIRVEGMSPSTVRQLLAWLGSATWPAEAIAGDGKLARQILDELDPALIEQVLPGITDPREIMGAVGWLAFRENDAAAMSAIGPAIIRLFATA